jgi:polyhydroxybutyrate depolymerase
LRRLEWKIEGVDREALVCLPARPRPARCPLVFAFHARGETAGQAAENFACHRHWPEAAAVYMQALNTPGTLLDLEGKESGWQRTLGDQNDRDVKFFDAVRATLLADFRTDAQRVYVAGHSNGGNFAYLLWAARGDAFAAAAACAAAVRPQFLERMRPKAVLHVAGEKDPLVRFEWQQRTMDSLRSLNACQEGMPWGERCTWYPSKLGAPVVACIHPGGHELPADAPLLIVNFFKAHGA